jgi:hypothetical protein
MSARSCNRFGQVSTCSVVTVLFYLDTSVSHSAQCRSSNNVRTSSSRADWENLLSALQQVYGDTALKKSAVYDWFPRFKNRQETFKDDQRSGRPSTSRTAEIIGKV